MIEPAAESFCWSPGRCSIDDELRYCSDTEELRSRLRSNFRRMKSRMKSKNTNMSESMA